MKRLINLLCMLLFSLNCLAQSELWDTENHIYVNHNYGFSWDLGAELDWSRTIGTERHTIFRAKEINSQIICFVNAQEVNIPSDKDIWDNFQAHYKLEQTLKNAFENKGVSYEIIKFEKATLWFKHAIKSITKVSPKNGLSANSEVASLKITYRTYHKGQVLSLTVTLPLFVYEELVKENIDVEELFSGFKFTVN